MGRYRMEGLQVEVQTHQLCKQEVEDSPAAMDSPVVVDSLVAVDSPVAQIVDLVVLDSSLSVDFAAKLSSCGKAANTSNGRNKETFLSSLDSINRAT